ncbi:hypothetical protein BD289DRAFT_364534 [Coniella lustricola]|uniref:Basic proline-rich protein n=1 Tax=Coniella lustricola TaxID=2025994 RepID=A0A2T3ADJ2_9PEZI|nr:hypothetical protein BD289DRAFT_364534 [Coniella lustricola]
MEPVPETEKLEDFRPAPVPTLRLQYSNYAPLSSSSSASSELESPRKPVTMRRATDPSPSLPVSPTWSAAALPYRPRTTSPLSGNHMRSKSAAALPLPMGRAHSLPGINGLGNYFIPRPESPSGSPHRARAMRKSVDEAYPPASPTRTSILDPERRHPERPTVTPSIDTTTALAPVIRHRSPSSPLRYGYTTSSSMPSTPISIRSRSPSISSLETIPDSPDAEEAAVEAEKIAQLKAAADAEDGGEPKSRSSLDAPMRGRTLMGFGSRDKRKRWSVCGAERRGDLDLETIWED